MERQNPELIRQQQIEAYWQIARSRGIDTTILDPQLPHSDKLGRVFESLGKALIDEHYPPDTFKVTTPQQTTRLRRYLTPIDERSSPRFPDGLILQRHTPNSLELLGTVEYKIFGNQKELYGLRDAQEQFEGFIGLVELMRRNNARRGKELMEALLGKHLEQFSISDSAFLMYVVPKNRTARDVATSLYGAEMFREMQFPATIDEIRGKMSQIKKQGS